MLFAIWGCTFLCQSFSAKKKMVKKSNFYSFFLPDLWHFLEVFFERLHLRAYLNSGHKIGTDTAGRLKDAFWRWKCSANLVFHGKVSFLGMSHRNVILLKYVSASWTVLIASIEVKLDHGVLVLLHGSFPPHMTGRNFEKKKSFHWQKIAFFRYLTFNCGTLKLQKAYILKLFTVFATIISESPRQDAG